MHESHDPLASMPGFGEGTDLSFKQAAARRALRLYGYDATFGHTPEVVTYTWQALWNAWQGDTHVAVTVPRPGKTHEEIKELESRGRMLIYVPEELSGPDALSALQALLPEQKQPYHWAGKHPAITVENMDQHGWLSVEKALWLPKESAFTSKMTELIAERNVRQEGIESGRLVGQTINTFVIGSLFTRLTTGHFLNEQWAGTTSGEARKPSILLGSRLRYYDEKGRPRHVPYALAQMGDPRKDSPKINRGLYEFAVWGWEGKVDYDAVRTVELFPPTRQKVRR